MPILASKGPKMGPNPDIDSRNLQYNAPHVMYSVPQVSGT